MTQSTYDYIVVGGGSAGSVLANRLSADGKSRVLLLEAGGRDNWIWFHIPVGYLFAIGNPRADWCFTTEQSKGLNGRVLSYPRGRVLGGSSAINAMIYMRGQAADYDHWRQMGLTGWGWDDVLPIFKAHEDHHGGGNDIHGVGGEWRVEPPRIKWPVLDTYRKAAAEVGIHQTEDFNSGENEGSAYFEVNQKRGRRWSSARGFLRPAMGRTNLDIRTGCLVDKVGVEEGRARTVTFQQNGVMHTVQANGEIVLSAGSIGTVQILQRSGIGPAPLLRKFGIPIVADRPGVGRNLQDHLQLRMIYKVSGVRTLNETYWNLARRGWMGVDYALRRRGPLTMAPSQLGVFTKSGNDVDRADLEMHIQPLSLDKFGDPLHKFPAITTSICNLRPESRGHVAITGSDMFAAPEIAPNYLSAPRDKEIAVRSIRIARKIAAAKAFASYRPEEYLPGKIVGDGREDLIRAAADIGTTIFHPVGTAKMGIKADPESVVDERLRVYGIQSLRIADASVMPTITSGNTNSPTIMIAEKAAKMMVEDKNH